MLDRALSLIIDRGLPVIRKGGSDGVVMVLWIWLRGRHAFIFDVAALAKLG